MEVTALNITKVGQSCSTSMIVTVWVSEAKNPSKEQFVYALLDTQSDSTFITKEVSNQFQTDSYPVKLKLTTMLGANMIMKSWVREYLDSASESTIQAFTMTSLPHTIKTAFLWIVIIYPPMKQQKQQVLWGLCAQGLCQQIILCPVCWCMLSRCGFRSSLTRVCP